MLYHENKKRADYDIIVTINTLLEPMPIIRIVHFIDHLILSFYFFVASSAENLPLKNSRTAASSTDKLDKPIGN